MDFLKINFIFSILLFSFNLQARVTIKESCEVRGTQSCIMFTKHGAFSSKKLGNPKCTPHKSEAYAKAACAKYEADREVRIVEAKKSYSEKGANEILVKQRTVKLERTWKCTGDGDLGKTEFDIKLVTTKAPVSANSREFKETQISYATLKFQCGSDSYINFKFKNRTKRLVAESRSKQCADNGDPLTVSAFIPMGKGQPQTPVELTGTANGKEYNMNSNDCKFTGSKVIVGGKRQPGYGNIKADSIPAAVAQ